DGVARARLDAEATEDAAELVDHELDRVALGAAALVALGVFARLDIDALRGARGRAAEARDAARAPVIADGEAMHAAEALRVRTLLLRVADRGDPVLPTLRDRVRAGPTDHVARVLEEVA